MTLPAHTHDGYVAAAYIVFFALLLIYVTIMAIRLGRIERKLDELRRAGGRADEPEQAVTGPGGGAYGGARADEAAQPGRRGEALEREAV
jgi:hypothetical protein